MCGGGCPRTGRVKRKRSRGHIETGTGGCSDFCRRHVPSPRGSPIKLQLSSSLSPTRPRTRAAAHVRLAPTRRDRPPTRTNFVCPHPSDKPDASYLCVCVCSVADPGGRGTCSAISRDLGKFFKLSFYFFLIIYK